MQGSLAHRDDGVIGKVGQAHLRAVLKLDGIVPISN
jgi:hypothetical protein